MNSDSDKNEFPNLSVPKIALLELTYSCNQPCIFCSLPWLDASGTYQKLPELSAGKWLEIIEKLVTSGVEEIMFSGGEPFARKDFPEIFKQASVLQAKAPVFDNSGKIVGMGSKKLEVSVKTNGQLIEKAAVAMLAAKKPKIVIGLPGLKTYGYHTGGGDVKKALDIISKLSEAGLTVSVEICVTKTNLSELSETILAAFTVGTKNFFLNRFLMDGRGKVAPDLSLNCEEITKMLDIAEEACKKTQITILAGHNIPKCLITKKYELVRVNSICSAGVDFFVIDPSGRIRPCNHSPFSVGAITDLESAISGSYWQNFNTKSFHPEMCKTCPLNHECDGGCREAAHLSRGSLSAPDPLFPPDGVMKK
ncbi:MAG: radical SAM protein [Candidatus Riflebacteria bacterium]|nr:radical SAM protein [Candidatus Riflebacteria bacterium]